MRDVNNGWLIRYLHSNTASAFFFLVYLHVGRGLYYGSYKAPRTLVWTIGTVILVLMMAIEKWPNWIFILSQKGNGTCLSKNMKVSRIKAIYRIGPHNQDVLSVLICGMLGDWWSDQVKGQKGDSVRFHIEQGVVNAAYIHHLTFFFNERGYSSYLVPKLVKKTFGEKTWFNYRLTLYTFTSLTWIHNSFYQEVGGIKRKVVPLWIGEYLTPIGLAHWIMQDGSRQKGQGIYIATNSFTYEECVFLCNVLQRKFHLNCTVVKTGETNQWRLNIWKESMPLLTSLVKPYIIDEMKYKFLDFL